MALPSSNASGWGALLTQLGTPHLPCFHVRRTEENVQSGRSVCGERELQQTDRVGILQFTKIDDYDCHSHDLLWNKISNLGCLGLSLSRSRDRPSRVEQLGVCVWQRLTRLAKPDIRPDSFLISSSLVTHLMNLRSEESKLVNARPPLKSTADGQSGLRWDIMRPSAIVILNSAEASNPKATRPEPKQNTAQLRETT
jgi:hypothetical protein